LKQFGDELRTAKESSKLFSLSARWAVETLDVDQLGQALNAVTDSATTMLDPIARIRYPSVFPALAANSAITRRAAKLVNAGVSSSLSELASDADAVVGAFLDEVTTASLRGTSTASNVTAVALSIPNPDVAPTSPSPWRKVDAATAASFWNEMKPTGSGRISLHVTPEMLYDKGLSAASVLSCNQAVPVIDSMALFVASGGAPEQVSALNLAGWNAPIAIDRAMTFSAAASSLDYTFDNPAWLSGGSGLRILFGGADQGGLIFNQNLARAQAQAGLSPFSRFDIDLRPFSATMGDTLRSAQEVVLFFQVDAQSVATPGVSWVRTCQ
jgi:hypothetical protein